MIQQLGSNWEDMKNVTLNYRNAGTMERDAEQLPNCLLHPLALQKNLDYGCNLSENDVTGDRPLATWTNENLDPNFTGVNVSDATNGKIPACVLEAVKYIESGTRTDFSGECRVNECSAAGPFQITTGVDNKGDTHCSQCNDTYRTKYKAWIENPIQNPEPKCPDGWLNDWPKTASDQSPCSDFNASAARAVEMLQEKARIRCETLDNNKPANEQREAIITAAGSYFGKNNPIDKFGGCSYGEFVYKHCDGSYVCGSNNVDLDVKYEQCQQQNNL